MNPSTRTRSISRPLTVTTPRDRSDVLALTLRDRVLSDWRMHGRTAARLLSRGLSAAGTSRRLTAPVVAS